MAALTRAEVEALKASMPRVLAFYGIRDIARNFSSPWRKDGNPSCHYYRDTNLVTDFGDGATVDVFGLVGKVEGIAGFPGQVRRVAEIAGTRLEDSGPIISQPFPKRERLRFEPPAATGFTFDAMESTLEAFFELYEPQAAPALAYLRRRGFDDADIVRNGLGFVPAARDFAGVYTLRETADVRGYIVIPYPLDREFSQVRYAMLRAVPGDAEPAHKEIRPTGVKSPLYHEYLLSEGLPLLYVVEGLLDAMAMEKLTGRPVLALGGTGLYRRLGQVLNGTPAAMRPARIIVAMDGDGPGRTCADRIAADLDALGIVHSRITWPPDCKDACDVLAREAA